MPGQPNRDCRDRYASVLSCHRPCCGALKSLCSQPIESDFIGSACTCASWIRPHLTHLSVQCSKPERAAMMRWTSMRDWHLGQRGRVAARGDRVGVCGSGNRCLPLIWREYYRTLCHRKLPTAGDDKSGLRPSLREMLVNIAHSQKIDRAQARGRKAWRNGHRFALRSLKSWPGPRWRPSTGAITWLTAAIRQRASQHLRISSDRRR
jgi:hypothetical protein